MSTTQDLKQDLKQVGRDMEQLVSNVGSNGAAASAAIREKVSPLLASARESIYAVSSDVKARASNAAKKTDAYAHEHPWQSIGIAAVAGLAIGALLSRRR